MIDAYTCKGKGGAYRVIGHSNGAGAKRGEMIVVYQDIGQPESFYHRTCSDFDERMEVAAVELLPRDVIDSLEWLGYTAPLPADIPQPTARAIALLEAFSQVGMTAKEGGKPTPNSLLCSRLAAELRTFAGHAPATQWAPVTRAGQVKAGDSLFFKIGDKEYREKAKEILHAGTDKEEVIYNKAQNFYFITAMVLSGFSNHKRVEFFSEGKAQ